MTGNHGFVSAPGARSAVLSAPVRRALLLAALVAGVLCAAWLTAAGPAQAQEKPNANANANANAAAQQQPGEVSQGRSEDAQGNTPATPAAAPPGLDGSVPGAAADAGEQAGQAVRGASESVGSKVSPGPAVAQQANDVVHEVIAPLPDNHPGSRSNADTGADTAREVDEVPDLPDGDEAVEAVEAVETDAGRGARDVETPAFADTDGYERATADDTADSDDAVDPAAAHAAHSALTTASAAAAPSGAVGGVAGGVVVADFLPVTGAPAPAPGELQAAWHVLHSVPAEAADEPTFSPD